MWIEYHHQTEEWVYDQYYRKKFGHLPRLEYMASAGITVNSPLSVRRKMIKQIWCGVQNLICYYLEMIMLMQSIYKKKSIKIGCIDGYILLNFLHFFFFFKLLNVMFFVNYLFRLNQLLNCIFFFFSEIALPKVSREKVVPIWME